MSRDLLADLAGYKSYWDKGVVMAARSLIQLYRTVRPELLQRKDRVGGAGGGVSTSLLLGCECFSMGSNFLKYVYM